MKILSVYPFTHISSSALLVDGKIISGEVGKIKPDPEIFYILTKTFNIIPENSVFIDDKLTNIKVANLIGFHGIQFQNATLLRNDLEKLKLI